MWFVVLNIKLCRVYSDPVSRKSDIDYKNVSVGNQLSRRSFIALGKHDL